MIATARAAICKHWKIYLIAMVVLVFCDLIGTRSVDIGIGTLTFYPLLYATIICGLLGPDCAKLYDFENSKAGGAICMIGLAPFMAKMGISAGGNLAKIVSVGPALFLQEFGNVGTILLSLPLALLLGMKRESIGACYSINRDANFALTTDIYGPDAPETTGTFSVYVVGSVIGTVAMGVVVSLVASWGVFHPYALGLASGVGSGSMMLAGVGTLSTMYPEYAEEIAVFGSVSDMLTGITGIYMGTFVALPITRKVYAKLEPILGRRRSSGRQDEEQ